MCNLCLVWMDFLRPGVNHLSLFRYPILVVLGGNALLKDLVMTLWNRVYETCVSCDSMTVDQSVSCKMFANFSLFAMV